MESGRRVMKLYAEHTATIFTAKCTYFMVDTFHYILNPSFIVFMQISMKFILMPTIAALSIISEDTQIFRKPRSHLKIPVARRAIITNCSTIFSRPR